MNHTVSTRWAGKMSFDSLVSGHHLIMDANETNGGENKGPRPKELMLSALAGCTGMDVVSILAKMKIVPESFQIHIDANVTEEHPKHYDKMHIIYEFTGSDLPMDKLQRAVELSQERYCGVSAAYKKAMPITWEIKISS